MCILHITLKFASNKISYWTPKNLKNFVSEFVCQKNRHNFVSVSQCVLIISLFSNERKHSSLNVKRFSFAFLINSLKK